MTPLQRWRPLWRRTPRWPAPDFLGGRTRIPLLAWAALLAALTTLAVCAVDAWQLESRIGEIRAQLAQWQLRASPPRRAAAPVVASASAPAANARALQALRRGAQHPWPLMFAGVESAGAHAATAAGEGGIAWLALEHERERAEVRLEGVARDAGRVLMLVDALAAEPGWSQVVLTRMADAERADSLAAGVRFEITGRLDDASASTPRVGPAP